MDAAATMNAAVANGQNGEAVQSNNYKLKFCTVCASNQNRSVLHHLLISATSC